MSSTEPPGGPRPTVGLPTRSRPPQPAPDRPVPPPADPTIPGPPATTGAVLLEAPPAARRRSLWPPRAAGVGSEVDEPREPGLSEPTRTTSASGTAERRPKVGQGELALTLSAVVFVLAGFSAWLVSRRGWELRPPDEDERLAMTDPIAAIVLRHTTADWLNADVLDGVKATAAFTTYAQSSPMYRPEKDSPDLHAADDDLTPGAF